MARRGDLAGGARGAEGQASRGDRGPRPADTNPVSGRGRALPSPTLLWKAVTAVKSRCRVPGATSGSGDIVPSER